MFKMFVSEPVVLPQTTILNTESSYGDFEREEA